MMATVGGQIMQYLARALARTVLAVALAGAATNAIAQYENTMPRVEKSPQVGAPRAEVSRIPYQQYTWNEECHVGAGTPTCTLDFDVVPANSRLEITNVSCWLQMSSAPAILRAPQLLVIGGGGTIVSASTLVPTVLFRREDETIWTLNHAVQVFADAGQRFQGWFNKDRFSGDLVVWRLIACHISGHLVKLQ
jgi:hypothetical protein